jgi:hypothetical protein
LTGSFGSQALGVPCRLLFKLPALRPLRARMDVAVPPAIAEVFVGTDPIAAGLDPQSTDIVCKIVVRRTLRDPRARASS